MNASRKRSSKAEADQHDSTSREREAEESAEKKVIHLWQSMDQMFGRRWGENYGNDPCGRYKDSEGKQNPRMELWIDTVKVMSWPQLKAAIQRIRLHPKPSEWWLPDLQFFSQIVGQTPSQPVEPRRPEGTWVDKVCRLYLLKVMFSHGPFSAASIETLTAEMDRTRQQYNQMVEGGELPSEWDEKEAQTIREMMDKKFARLVIDPLPEDERATAMERWQRRQGLLRTKVSSNSSTPTGRWDQEGQSSFV